MRIDGTPVSHTWSLEFVSFRQFQTETSSLEASWDMSGDPCPASKYEWSIEQTDGTILQSFIDMYST